MRIKLIFLHIEHEISGGMFLEFTKKEMQSVVTDEETVLKLQELQMKAMVGLLLVYS